MPDINTTIDLGLEGLSDGDYIDDLIDQHRGPGVELYIPPGDYDTDVTWLDGMFEECAIVGDPAGVTLHKIDPPLTGNGGDCDEFCNRLRFDGHVVIENITFRGRLGQPRARWLDPEGLSGSANLELRNVNFPDGSLGCSDSYVGRAYGSGRVDYRWCFIGPHANAAFYQTPTGSIRQVFDGCVVYNCSDVWRGGTRDYTVINSLFIADDDAPDWSEGGSNSDGMSGSCWNSAANPFKFDQSLDFNGRFENLHLVFKENCPGIADGVFDFQDNQSNTSGVMDDIYIYNDVESSVEDRQFDHHTGSNLGGWDIGDVHITGAWGTDSINMSGVNANVVPNPDMPVMELPPVWTPGGAGLPDRLGGEPACSSDADCPGDLVCENGRCVVPVPDETSDFFVQSTLGDPDGQRSEFHYRVVVEGYMEVDEADDDANAGVRIVSEDPLRMEATGETGNQFNDHYHINGTVVEAVVTEMDADDDLGPVSPGDGMIWIVDGVEYEDPTGMTFPDPNPPPDEPPIADFDVVADGLTVDVDATPSVDPDGQIVSYEWTAGGQSATGKTASFTFDTGGIITIALTVTDDAGMQDQAFAEVELVDPPDDGNGGTPDPSEGGLTPKTALMIVGVGAAIAHLLTRGDDEG